MNLQLLNCLDSEIYRPVNSLASQCNLTPEETQTALLQLQLLYLARPKKIDDEIVWRGRRQLVVEHIWHMLPLTYFEIKSWFGYAAIIAAKRAMKLGYIKQHGMIFERGEPVPPPKIRRQDKFFATPIGGMVKFTCMPSAVKRFINIVKTPAGWKRVG